MAVVFEKPKALTDAVLHYCPGCPHGIIHRLVAEAIDELGIEGKTIGVAPVGCAVMAYDYFACDMIEAAHGRAPATATGIKRCRPDNIVFTYQGDGDLASIGMAETVHAAARNENITIIFVNNAIYGMTGGQMAPTSLPGQVTQTSPYGRDVNHCGWPIKVSEMLSTHSSAFWGVMPQLVGQAETTSTREKPFPSTWFWNAFLMAFFAFFTFLTLLTATRVMYSGPSRVASISLTRMGQPQ